MKRTLFFCLFILVFFTCASSAHAQQYEVVCPSGTTVVNSAQGVTFDSVTGKYRQNICIDNAGNVYGNNFSGTGAPPAGANQCVGGQLYTNTSNGTLYTCFGTTWLITPAGTIGGLIADTQVAYGTGPNTIGNDGNFIWGLTVADPPRKQLTVQGSQGVLRPYNYTNVLNSTWSIDFSGHQADAATALFGDIQQTVISNANGAVSGQFDIHTMNGGVLVDSLKISKEGNVTIADTSSTKNFVSILVNDVLRAIITKDTAGNVLGVDLYPDPAITNHGAAATTGNFFWALAQIPVTGGFINIHGQAAYTFNTAITDSTHVKVKITCDGWATTITQGSSGTNIWYIGGGGFASTGWEIRDCGFIGLGSGTDTGAGIHFGATSFNNIVEHNYIFNFQGSFGGIDWSNSFNNITDGNIFDTNNVGVELSGTNNEFGNKITNNTFLNGHGPAIQADFPYQTIISGNTMTNNGDFGTSAILTSGSYASTGLMVITNNMISGPGKYCIELNQAPAGAQTVSSTITGNSCTTSGTYSIWLGTGENNNTVGPNSVNKPVFTIGASDQIIGKYICSNITPVTTSGGSTTNDQNTLACAIPAGTLDLIGKTLSIWYRGLYTTNAANLSTINLKVKICSVSGCSSGNVLTLATITSAANAGGVTNFTMSYVGDATTQTAGAALAEESHGLYTIDIAATSVLPETVYSDTNTATLTGLPSSINSTAQNFLQISCAFSIASASNTCQGRQLIIESIQ